MFTKEHFETVAEILHDSAATHCDAGIAALLVSKFADMFEQSNERFSRRAFEKACDPNASRSEIRRLVQSNNKRLAG